MLIIIILILSIIIIFMGTHVYEEKQKNKTSAEQQETQSTKVCSKCKHVRINPNGEFLCNHPKATYFDSVTGEKMAPTCRKIRYNDISRFANCGRNGELPRP